MSAQCRASSRSRKEKASAPTPFCAAILIVSRLVQAIHIGRCGTCTGLVSTLRQGMVKYLPAKPGYGSSTIMLASCSAASSAIARFSLAGIRKPPSIEPRGDFADAEVDPSVGNDIERGEAFCGAYRMVVIGNDL